MKKKFFNKNSVIVALLLVTLAIFGSATITWVTYSLEPGSAAFTELRVSGTAGLTPLMPILVALLAITITLTIVRPIPRLILGVLIAVLTVWVAVKSIGLLLSGSAGAIAFGSQQLAEATGFAATEHARIVNGVTVSLWPLVTFILAVIIGLLGLAIVLFGRGWATGGRKYQVKLKRQQNDRISDWDALSDGQDPSDDEQSADSVG